jgi:hypothetical protein
LVLDSISQNENGSTETYQFAEVLYRHSFSSMASSIESVASQTTVAAQMAAAMECLGA